MNTDLARRVVGATLILAGLVSLAAPILTGGWALQFLAVPVLVTGIVEAYRTLRSDQALKPHAYLDSALAIVAAVLLFVSPALVAGGLVVLLIAWLALDGIVRVSRTLAHASAAYGSARLVAIINGIASLVLCLLVWFVWRFMDASAAIGLAVGGYAINQGWRWLVTPVVAAGDSPAASVEAPHPDTKLGLSPHPLLVSTRERMTLLMQTLRGVQLSWFLTGLAILFAIHLARMQSGASWLGMVSPVVATVGDLAMSLAIGIALILPLRLLWRRLTRPLERAAWRLRIGEVSSAQPDTVGLHGLAKWTMTAWTESRFAFSLRLSAARQSLPSALGLAMRLGLPITALFVAINPIWGFSWYFNTESWASGIYQKVTELRVDTWRREMVDAVRARYASAAIADESFFDVTPAGLTDQDFSFIVIGDPGEGDASQFALVDQYLKMGRRPDIRFLLVSSDVIYPAGAMTDYESNFYLPFQGFSKPVFAIPGNHDWFDALEGFNANFLEEEAARAALAARASVDLHLTGTDQQRIDGLLMRAGELRRLYGVQTGLQRAPYFEIQTPQFALLAIDTGILRSIDERQLDWLESALVRSAGKFTMALLGHPRYASGTDTAAGHEPLRRVYELLRRHNVRIAMAGDTHDFEYYALTGSVTTGAPGMQHFVNGGGGAYLSIGTALDWPAKPAAERWAFYPTAESLRAKLDAETPGWKKPIWLWVRRLGGWPLSSETLSGMFDFNHAPFFQSFMEVRVETSRNRVVLALHGARGPVHWGELSKSADSAQWVGKDGDPVEFVLSLRASTSGQ